MVRAPSITFASSGTSPREHHSDATHGRILTRGTGTHTGDPRVPALMQAPPRAASLCVGDQGLCGVVTTQMSSAQNGAVLAW